MELRNLSLFSLSAKINIFKYRKYELSTEKEKFINCSTLTAVISDSHSIADTVDTDCLTVAAVNRFTAGSAIGRCWRNGSPSVRMILPI